MKVKIIATDDHKENRYMFKQILELSLKVYVNRAFRGDNRYMFKFTTFYNEIKKVYEVEYL